MPLRPFGPDLGESMRDLRVAAVCMKADPGDIQANLRRIERFAVRAAERGAQVVCYPELAVTGYTLKRPLDLYRNCTCGETVARILEIAARAGILLLVGLVEPCDNRRPFIAHLIAGPKGLLGCHQKTHLSPPESRVYQAGRKLEIFSIRQARFGIQLCYEAHFPEISTVMALGGGEILFVPHASPRGDPRGKLSNWLRHLPARALDNAVFVVACNQVGTTGEGLEFPGVVLFLGPDGRVLSSYAGEKEEIILVDLKGSELKRMRSHRMRYFLPGRRTDLYGPLLGKDASTQGMKAGDGL